MSNRNSSKLSFIRIAISSLLVALASFYATKVRRYLPKKPVSSPADFSLKTWRKALLEAKNAATNKSLPVLGAGVAYYATLAFFPLMAAAVAIAAFLISDDQLQAVVSALGQYMPADVASLVSSQLQTLSEDRSGNIVIATISILISLFSVSSAVKHLVSATNIAYGVTEHRGFVKQRLLSFVMTVSALVFGVLVLPLLIVNSSFLQSIGLSEIVADILLVARWPLLIGLVVVVLAAFYRYGPNRKNPTWQWVSWGAVIATSIWLVITVLFFIYAQNFANFSETYSLFAGIIVLMIWLNVSALAVLLGAEINHRLELKR